MRILELKILKDKVPANRLFDFIKRFNVVETDESYLNLLSRRKDDNLIFNLFKIPIDSYYLTKKMITNLENLEL